jgi:enoyl-CoA hydratase/carnithine racemase
MSYETLAYDVADRVATITLNRPDRLNAFNATMMEELLGLFDRIDGDDDVRAVIVTGAGRGFCAGADLEAGGQTFDAGAKGRDPERVNRDGGGRVSLRIFELTKPIIAAINGPAVGVGITMTLPMDVRLAAESARIGFVFARRGIVPEAASSWFLPRLVGISQATQWCYSGRVMPAEEAARGGLVELVPDDQLLARANEMAAEIATHAAPVSVALTRQMLWRGLTFDHPMQAHRADSRAIQELGRLADAREGVTSFLEKRDPQWSLKPSEDTPEVFPFWEDPEFS